MVFPIILLICAATPGVLVRRGREQADTARGEVERSAMREAALAEQAVVDERARIARELHDVVAHAVSIMVVQAAAADELLERDPARAHAALDAVQRTGRSAIEELARMLELLRGEGDADAPLPTLRHLPALLDEARASGVDVDLVQDIAGPPLPPAVELCAYRVVQEALTNAAKHTLRPRVQVRLSRNTDGQVEILVENDGGAGPRSSDGTGHGLLGLRERVSVFGGRLDAAPGPDGGYRVLAVVPTGANA
jgi:signal transduction histidine kinase